MSVKLSIQTLILLYKGKTKDNTKTKQKQNLKVQLMNLLRILKQKHLDKIMPTDEYHNRGTGCIKYSKKKTSALPYIIVFQHIFFYQNMPSIK